MSDWQKWLMGIAASLLVATVTGLAGVIWGMSERVTRLEATQIQLIKQIDRTLDTLVDG